MNRFCLDVAALLVLVAGSHSVLAETHPPPTPFDSITWNATMKKKPSMGITMGAFRVQFERTTLDDVRQSVAAGTITHQGDGGESSFWLCYTNSVPTHVERIWILSHGEMGGPEHYITGVSAEVIPNASATQDCPALPTNMRLLSLDNGLWLNGSASQARTKLGPPSHQEGAWQSYNFLGKVPGSCEDNSFDLTNWLWLHFSRGRINSLQVGQVTSC